MYVARILYPVRTLGPGCRIGLWMSGCHRGCPGCSNPELWEQREDQRIDVQQLSMLLHRIARQHPVDGLTVTGGEPFEQCEELSVLLHAVADITEDILIYSGCTLAELKARHSAAVDAILGSAAVLIDSPYVQALNTGLPLRGSANQQIHVLRGTMQDRYAAYLREPCHGVQNFMLGGSIVSVGIHRPGYTEELPMRTSKKGLKPRE